MLDKIQELLGTVSRQTWIMIGLIMTTLLAVGLLLFSNQPRSDSTPEINSGFYSASSVTSMASSASGVATQTSATNITMYVDVKGAVKQPGLKKVDQSMRVIDAIQLAGGFASNADQKQVNLAQRLTDQQVVYIPKHGEEAPATANGGTTAAGASSEAPQVNLNTADITQLQQLDGVGEKKAEKILAYRQEHGQFQSIEELKEVNGFGDKTLERLKPQLAV